MTKIPFIPYNIILLWVNTYIYCRKGEGDNTLFIIGFWNVLLVFIMEIWTKLLQGLSSSWRSSLLAVTARKLRWYFLEVGKQWTLQHWLYLQLICNFCIVWNSILNCWQKVSSLFSLPLPLFSTFILFVLHVLVQFKYEQAMGLHYGYLSTIFLGKKNV